MTVKVFFLFSISLLWLCGCNNGTKPVTTEEPAPLDAKDKHDHRTNTFNAAFYPHPELQHAYIMTANPHWREALNKPVWKKATFDTHMRHDDPVVGFYFNNTAYAMPWWILKNHHVANLFIEDTAILVTFCEQCSSSVTFKSEINGRRHTFQIAGIYKGTHIIEDNETKTLWSPFDGEGLYGPLKGFQLDYLPNYQCNWHEWKELHPETFVLFDDESRRLGHGHDNLPGVVRKNEWVLERSVTHEIDQTMKGNELIFGIIIDTIAKAYPLKKLDTLGAVLTDSINGQSLVIFHKVNSRLAMAFSPMIGDQPISFYQSDDGEIRDSKTSSKWNIFGEATAGKLSGKKLKPIPCRLEEWYAWHQYHPETLIYK